MNESSGAKMGKLLYTAITSLDGYVADEQCNFDEHRFGSGVVFVRYAVRR